jgi:hypothetical protein
MSTGLFVCLERIVELAVFILATWRLASLLAQEAGPFDLFARLRYAAGVRYGDDGAPYGHNVLAEGIVCVWCCSVWVGVVLAAAWWYAPDVAFWIAAPFALSGGATLIHEVIDG